jgi:hypothetical protein
MFYPKLCSFYRNILLERQMAFPQTEPHFYSSIFVWGGTDFLIVCSVIEQLDTICKGWQNLDIYLLPVWNYQ